MACFLTWRASASHDNRDKHRTCYDRLAIMSVVPRNGKVAVIGAGVSGLCYSYFLSKLRPDVQISVFESKDAPGGWIKSLYLNDNGQRLILEKGPRTLRGVSDGTLLIVDIMKELGLENDVEVMRADSKGNRKWLLGPANDLVQVPNSLRLFGKFLQSEVSEGLVTSVLKEPFGKRLHSESKDESIRSFITRRFGSPQLADNILSAIMHGIYSGDVERLSIKSTMPSLVELEREHGSILKAMIQRVRKKSKTPERSPALEQYERLIAPGADLRHVSNKLKRFPIMRLKNGLQTFPLKLAEYLGTLPNVQVKLNNAISDLDLESGHLQVHKAESPDSKDARFDHVRFTLGLKALEATTQIKNSGIQQAFKSMEYSTIFLANVYAKRGGLIPKDGSGFGFLVPKRNANPESLLGVIYDSDTELDAERFLDGQKLTPVPYSKLTLMLGGHYFNSRGVPSDSINLKSVRNVLTGIMGVDMSKFNLVIRNEAKETSKDVSLSENDLLVSYNLNKECIPQYNVGFEETTQNIISHIQQASHGRVSLGGPTLGKLGVPDCVMNELKAALEAAGLT